jgi:hypothetical protein
LVAEEIDFDTSSVVAAAFAAEEEGYYHTPREQSVALAAAAVDNSLRREHPPDELVCKLHAVGLAAGEADVAAEIHCCSKQQEHSAVL